MLNKSLLVTLDAQVCAELGRWSEDVTCKVVRTTAYSNKGASFNEHLYWEQVVFRQVVHSALLEAGVNVFLVESDAAWFSDPLQTAPFSQVLDRSSGVDVAVIYDSLNKHQIAAGLMLSRGEGGPASAIRQVWMVMKQILAAKKGLGGGEEQAQFMKVYPNAGVRFKAGTYDQFPIGKWYEKRETIGKAATRPVVINNNWLFHAHEKVARAKKFHHWFTDESGQCLPTWPQGFDQYFPN